MDIYGVEREGKINSHEKHWGAPGPPSPESAIGTECAPSPPGHIFGSSRDTLQAIRYHPNQYFQWSLSPSHGRKERHWLLALPYGWSGQYSIKHHL